MATQHLTVPSKEAAKSFLVMIIIVPLVMGMVLFTQYFPEMLGLTDIPPSMAIFTVAGFSGVLGFTAALFVNGHILNIHPEYNVEAKSKSLSQGFAPDKCAELAGVIKNITHEYGAAMHHETETFLDDFAFKLRRGHNGKPAEWNRFITLTLKQPADSAGSLHNEIKFTEDNHGNFNQAVKDIQKIVGKVPKENTLGHIWIITSRIVASLIGAGAGGYAAHKIISEKEPEAPAPIIQKAEAKTSSAEYMQDWTNKITAQQVAKAAKQNAI